MSETEKYTDRIDRAAQLKVPSHFGSPFDFRNLLENELKSRCHANPRYSLRAFAKTLGLESSYLSKVLRGERRITLQLIERCKGPLGIGMLETGFFVTEVIAKPKKRKKPSFQELSLDYLKIISEWQHFAILELCALDDFEPNPKWIADKISIPKEVAQTSITRLVEAGMLIQKPNGDLKCAGNYTTAHHPLANHAGKQLQRSIVQKALIALEQTPFEERDQTALTIAIDSSKLEKAKKLLTQFRRRFMSLMEEGNHKDAVYNLSLSFYPLTGPNTTPTF